MVAIRAGGNLRFFAASGHLPPSVNEMGSSLGRPPNCCVEGIKGVLDFRVGSGSLPRPCLGCGIRELVRDSDASDRCESCCVPQSGLGDLPSWGEAQRASTAPR